MDHRTSSSLLNFYMIFMVTFLWLSKIVKLKTIVIKLILFKIDEFNYCGLNYKTFYSC
jgi:hypothetical protein